MNRVYTPPLKSRSKTTALLLLRGSTFKGRAAKAENPRKSVRFGSAIFWGGPTDAESHARGDGRVPGPCGANSGKIFARNRKPKTEEKNSDLLSGDLLLRGGDGGYTIWDGSRTPRTHPSQLRWLSGGDELNGEHTGRAEQRKKKRKPVR